MEKLNKENIEDILALTPMQEGMLFHYLKDPQSNYYFEQLCLEISGNIDKEIFEKSWNFVIETNEMLRTVFRWEKVDNPVQIILKENSLQPRYYDFSPGASHEIQKRLEQVKVKDREEKFDLREVPFRVTLCKLEKAKYVMIISNHHILYDGWSNGIILKKFFNTYHDLFQRKSPSQQVESKFKGFVKWYHQRDKDKEKKFWKDYLQGFDTQSMLPIKQKTRDKSVTDKYCLCFETDTVDQLETFIKQHKLTLAAFLYTAWGILLMRYTNSDDVIFGTTVSGRSALIKGIEDVVGLFINTLPLRVYSRRDETTADLLYRIDNTLRIRESYEHTSLVDIKECSEIDRNQELFDCIVVIENYPLDRRWRQGTGVLAVHSYTMEEGSHYDLTISVMLHERENIDVDFSYKTGCFNKKTINRLVGHFTGIVREIIAEPGKEPFTVEMLGEEEKKRLLVEFNNTEVDYPKDKSIYQLFEEQTGRTPDNIALLGSHELFKSYEKVEGTKGLVPSLGTVSITYKKLNQQSHRLAHLLIEKGVRPDTIAAVVMERSIEVIIGILGILKSGGAYLPIDPQYPQERIHYMLTDSSASVLITTPGLFEKDENMGIWEVRKNFEIVLLDFSALPSSHLHLSPVPATYLSYVIYTSGTTGQPKGSLIEHRNVVRLLFNDEFQFDFSDRDVWTLFHSYCFDFSVWEMYGALLYGGKLFIVPKMMARDTVEFMGLLNREAVTVLNQTPSAFYNLINEGLIRYRQENNLYIKYVIFGGEALNPLKLKDWLEKYPQTRLINMFGITETTVHVTYKELNKEDIELNISNIGKPIPTLSTYILDRYLKPVPVGVTGEICVGGDGVVRGYLNQVELTAGKFIENLYRLGDRLYRSGDTGRFLENGDIEYLGRIDNQVKIRGFRIELAEIENQLLKYGEIKNAVVLAGETSGEKYLCAYIVADKELILTELRTHLSGKLPDYMIPSYFVRLEKIPLTPNRKIDRRALPIQELIVGESYTAPGNEIEKKLVGLWSDILGGDALHSSQKHMSIGINDNFFELGGHSLKAMILVFRIEKTFNVKISLSEIFKNPRIRELAAYIKDAAQWKHEHIALVEKKEYYVLSSAQKRLYFLQQMDKDGTAYNIPSSLLLEGIVDKDKLEQSIAKLIRRHESLRTSIELIQEEPIQRIHERMEFQVENYKIQNAEYKQITNYKLQSPCQKKRQGPTVPFGQINAFGDDTSLTAARNTNTIIKSSIRPFDLSKAPLLRVGLINIEKDRHIFLVDMHHIISDGMSTQVLVQDFSALYAGKELPLVKLHYKDYAEWQNRERVSKKILEQGEYWKKEYEGKIPVLELPTDYARPAVQGFEGSSKNFEINSETAGALKAFAIETGATLHIVLLALYNIFLAKISSQEDIIIGTPIAGRKHADLEKIIGMFVNTLALRNYPLGEKTFTSFLLEVKERTLRAFENQDYQYEDLVEQVLVTRELSRNPLFDTMFVLQNISIHALEIPGLRVVAHEYENKTSKFDLTLIGIEANEKLLFTFEYSTKLFKRETVERFIAYFVNIIRGVVENRKKRISDIQILTEEEKNRILFEFNDTEREYPKDKTLHRLFEEQAKQTPDRIALVGAAPRGCPACLTYCELNDRSNRLAYLLTGKGVLPDNIAAIMIDRSIEMLIGILGILKSGGAYLPIDPEYPKERIDYILKESIAKVLVTTHTLATEFEMLRSGEDMKNFRILFLDTHSSPSILTFDLPNFLTSYPANLAYIIYTSGSTGKPRGVMVEHRSVVNLLSALNHRYPMQEQDTYLLKTSYLFDVSVTELFGWFLEGGRLAVLETGGEKDPEAILETIVREGVTHINFVPSMFHTFVEILESREIAQLPSLKYIFLAGEALPPGIARRSRQMTISIALENIYGPTEAVVYASWYSISGWDGEGAISIGKPLPNVTLYILDKWNNIQPIGVVGELCISGVGLARGYLNNPALTFEKFCLQQPGTFLKKKFQTSKNFLLNQSTFTTHHSLIYKTGDLARWLMDGNIEFLGRIDYQVKIRGFRVELGEIENRLLEHDEIKEGVVVLKTGEQGDKYLCAYIVPKGSQPGNPGFSIKESGLREYLLSGLPGYMVPSYYILMDKLPLTPNGKIDRKALPVPELKAGDNYEVPRDRIEKKLVEIWSEILPVNKEFIGVYSNFFELGGHSLQAINLMLKVHKEMNIKIKLADIFNRPMVSDLAAFIANASKNNYSSIPVSPRKEYYTLSSPQKRLFFMEQFNDIGTSYNMSFAYTIEGKCDKKQLSNAFKKIIKRHEILRTSFEMVNDKPVQKIHDEVDFAIKEIKDESSIEKILDKFIQPFDLEKVPLLRVGLCSSGEGKSLLLIDLHHILSDDVSTGIMISELTKLYMEEKLPPQKIQYKDFSEWQDHLIQSGALKGQEDYWLRIFPGKIPGLKMPLDFPKTVHQYFVGDEIHFNIDKEVTAKMKKFTSEKEVTFYMLLLAVYNILLFKYTGQQDLIVGSSVMGRPFFDLKSAIGMFVNFIAIRNFPTSNKTFEEFLKEVKINALEAYENQDYPFEELVNKLKIQREFNRNPLFSTVFDFHNIGFDLSVLSVGNLKFTSHPFKKEIARFDIEFNVIAMDSHLRVILQYGTKLFKKSTMEHFVSRFLEIIKTVITRPDIQLGDIDILVTEERDKLIKKMRKECGISQMKKKSPVAVNEMKVKFKFGEQNNG